MNDSPKNVLALLPNWIGDVAMCTPALRSLHRRFPAAELTVAGRKAACQLLEGLPWIERRIVVPARPGFGSLVKLSRELRPYAKEVTVIFPHSFRAAALAWLSGAEQRVGYARGFRSWLLNRPVAPYRERGRIQPVYMGQEYQDLCKALGCEDDAEGLELAASSEAVSRAMAVIGPDKPVVGIAPGAAFGGSKRWPVERFAQVADALAEQTGATYVLLTSPDEADLRSSIQEQARTPFVETFVEQPSIDDLKAAVSQLDLLVCNDSGARHVAVAFDVPTVCIMGPTKPAYSEGPYERGQVLRIDVDCGPCQRPVCRTDHRCMTGVSVDWVVESALRILASKKE
jgi:heptosyltransferase II